jgi:hypothetical protein
MKTILSIALIIALVFASCPAFARGGGHGKSWGGTGKGHFKHNKVKA